MSQRRLIITVFCLVIVAAASANGAMGLGMEMWDMHYWYPYVFATLVLEGWMIGVWLELKPFAIVFWTLFVNFVTAIFCCGGPLATVGLHGAFVGTSIDPNPFLNGVFLLSAYAMPSAILEYAIWERVWAKNVYVSKKTKWRLFLQVINAHLLGIPIGLAILLIPARPYVGLEATCGYWRRSLAMRLEKTISEKLNIKLTEGMVAMPDLQNPKGQESLLQHDGRASPRLAFIEPEFGRFSTGSPKDAPIEWNSALSGRKLIGLSEKPVWIIRCRGSRQSYGITVQSILDESGTKADRLDVHFSRTEDELGLKPSRHKQ